MLLEMRQDEAPAESPESTTLDAVIEDLFAQLDSQPAPDRTVDDPPCVGHNNTPIFAGNVVCTPAPVTLRMDRSKVKERTRVQRALRRQMQEVEVGSS